MRKIKKMFFVSVSLENDDMKTPAEVATALENVIKHLHSEGFDRYPINIVQDSSGETVGHWGVLYPEH